jgi:hypothetical protein
VAFFKLLRLPFSPGYAAFTFPIVPTMAIFLAKCNHGMIEADKQKNIELKERELDAKITGDIQDQVINIEYSEAIRPKDD